MRRLKQISLAVVLMFTLATGAMAGITEAPPEPPPPPSAPATETTDTPSLNAQATNDATDPVIEFALTVLQSVLLAF